jgi:hypothetical protein
MLDKLPYCKTPSLRISTLADLTRNISCPDDVTLVVGPEKVPIKCNKALLALKSEYFDAVCFGGLARADTDEIEVREEIPKAMKIFVSWLYSGQILSSTFPHVEMWLLGDRLRSPQFTNEVMHTLFGKCYERRIHAEEYQLMFANTTPESKLRKYFRDVVLSEGPLQERWNDGDVLTEAWKDLVKQGGELVVDIAMRGSFCNSPEDDEEPWFYNQHYKYLEPITTRPIEDFIAGKPREGTR